jgi:hypothetical protein
LNIILDFFVKSNKFTTVGIKTELTTPQSFQFFSSGWEEMESWIPVFAHARQRKTNNVKLNAQKPFALSPALSLSKGCRSVNGASPSRAAGFVLRQSLSRSRDSGRTEKMCGKSLELTAMRFRGDDRNKTFDMSSTI